MQHKYKKYQKFVVYYTLITYAGTKRQGNKTDATVLVVAVTAAGITWGQVGTTAVVSDFLFQ